MSSISFSVRGLEIFARMRDELGDKKADAIASQTCFRVAKTVRTKVAREIASQTGIKKSLIDRRLTTWSKDGWVTLRFGGTGKFGRGFIRPRDLGLKVPKVGKYKTGRTRFGAPAVSKPKPESYPRGFILDPQKGMAWSFKGFDGRIGKKSQLFIRTGRGREPIARVPGVRLADMVNLPPLVAQANTDLASGITKELERRFIAELGRIAQKSSGGSGKVLPTRP